MSHGRTTISRRFITFEGGEGSGKSTQSRLLAGRLREAGRAVVLTREPGGSPFAERVRTLILDPATPRHAALAEALLFYAARADHWAATIEPALMDGAWVVCDRYSDSTRVYQGLVGGLGTDFLKSVERAVFADAEPPRLTVVIDVPVDVGLARAKDRRTASAQVADTYEARDVVFHERIRAGYLEIARAEPDRCVIIDGSGGEEDVGRAVWTAVLERLGAEVG